jgi:hypothetical protein
MEMKWSFFLPVNAFETEDVAAIAVDAARQGT